MLMSLEHEFQVLLAQKIQYLLPVGDHASGAIHLLSALLPLIVCRDERNMNRHNYRSFIIQFCQVLFQPLQLSRIYFPFITSCGSLFNRFQDNKMPSFVIE